MSKTIKTDLDQVVDVIDDLKDSIFNWDEYGIRSIDKDYIRTALEQFVVEEDVDEGRNRIFEPPYIILKVQYQNALRNINDLRQEILYLSHELEKHKIMKEQLSKRLFDLTKHQHGLPTTPTKGGSNG